MIQKKTLKEAIQNPEIISVVGGLLGEKVPMIFPRMSENNVKGGWLRLATIINRDAFSRDCSMMEVHFANYNCSNHAIILIGIRHGATPAPFLVCKGGNTSFKLAYKSSDSNTDIYIYFAQVNSCIEKKWVTKSSILTIQNDNIEYIGNLPDGATEIQLS
jgi:hypothetical protein|nr:MAG TPA: hypothetical protein [Bacteriophage sp.]